MNITEEQKKIIKPEWDKMKNFIKDTDSIQAEKTYRAVQDEYNNLKMLYSESELELLREINQKQPTSPEKN